MLEFLKKLFNYVQNLIDNHDDDVSSGKDLTSLNPKKELLEYIAKYESGNNPNIVWGGETKPLTSMTLDEVIDWQQSQNRFSTAAGKYQFIQITLEFLKDKLKLTGDELFTEELQDKLALSLLNRRGLSKYLKGKLGSLELMKNLSKEWAALPKDMSGVSYYADDGVNIARADPKELLNILAKLKQV